mgnify:CR=1 FL=1
MCAHPKWLNNRIGGVVVASVHVANCYICVAEMFFLIFNDFYLVIFRPLYTYLSTSEMFM